MVKKRLLIVGAGDFGRELESWLSLCPVNDRDWDLHGYLDSNPAALDGFQTDYKIVGDPFTYSFQENDLCAMSITDCVTKEKVFEAIKGKVKFLTFIAPTAIIGKFTSFGEGTLICPGCIVSTNTRIGRLVIVNIGSQIGHDVEIGDYSSLMANIDIGGHVKIGEKTYIGTGATIIPKRVIAKNVRIGAGSVVLHNIKENLSVFGNPAGKISY